MCGRCLKSVFYLIFQLSKNLTRTDRVSIFLSIKNFMGVRFIENQSSQKIFFWIATLQMKIKSPDKWFAAFHLKFEK